MSEEEQPRRVDPDEKTIQAAGRIVKYSREIYHLESVEDVANMTLEATPHFIEGHPTPTVVEIRTGDLRVLESMHPAVSAGDEPGAVVSQAYEAGGVVVRAGESAKVVYESDEIVVEAAGDTDNPDGVTIAAPTVYPDEVGDSGAVLEVHWPSLPRVEQYHVKPVAYLAEHVATALVNIRSRERLERARTDLAKRKEMVEVYDRLLRHDLGNDLQIITGFSEVVESMLDADDEAREYVQKIHTTSESAADLIDTVGETVRTLKQGGEPEVTDVEPVLSNVVDTVLTKHETLSIHYDPDEFGFQVYVGDLVDSVFTNVLSNAVVHNGEHVTVHLYSETPTPETVVIGMADDGRGVPEEFRDDIFQMGRKGPDSDGTGFGLGLARTLVESYGGTVDVRDSEFGGADFRITLQRA